MGGTSSGVEKTESKNLEKFSHFETKDIKNWTESFYKAFPDGFMRLQDLEKLFKSFFPFGNPKGFSEVLFKAINISSNEKVDFHEMLISFSILTKGSNFEKLRWLFRFYDCDCDGVVSKSELLHCVNALEEMVGATLEMEIDAKTLVDEIFCEVQNESGFLTFDDFKSISSSKKRMFSILNIFNES